jgi:SAM-dependent methyltransferase
MNLRWKIAQFFEAWWWRHYLRGKSEQDYLAWKRQYWQRFLDETGTWPAPAETVLDAGCGPAGIFLVLNKNRVTAVDPLLGKYRQQLAFLQNGAFPGVHFIEMPLEKYKPDAAFDHVFCLNAINHVADLDVCLQNLRQVTKDSGQLALTVDAHNFSWLKKLFRMVPGDILHPHQLDLQEYLEKLEKSGFRIRRTKLLKRELIFSYHLVVAEAG